MILGHVQTTYFSQFSSIGNLVTIFVTIFITIFVTTLLLRNRAPDLSLTGDGMRCHEVLTFYCCGSPKREMDHYSSTDADVAHVPQVIRHLRPTPWLRGRNGKEVEEGASEKICSEAREISRAIHFRYRSEICSVIRPSL